MDAERDAHGKGAASRANRLPALSSLCAHAMKMAITQASSTKHGLPRAAAVRVAAQTISGACGLPQVRNKTMGQWLEATRTSSAWIQTDTIITPKMTATNAPLQSSSDAHSSGVELMNHRYTSLRALFSALSLWACRSTSHCNKRDSVSSPHDASQKLCSKRKHRSNACCAAALPLPERACVRAAARRGAIHTRRDASQAQTPCSVF